MARAPASPQEVPEADRFADAPHPRETQTLYGHDAAERDFLDAWQSGRMHHAWLIGGPEGIGKATLAYRIARFVLAGGEGADGLALPADHTVTRRVAALGHPDLIVVRRAWDEKPKPPRFKTVISVDEVRKAIHFFQMSAGAGGWRVAIVDAADEMNIQAENALLKTLEEPPQKSLLLLVSHAPGRLLPTIRSRCRRLLLQPPGRDELFAALADAGQEAALAALDGKGRDELATHARGSVRRALQLLDGGALAIFREVDAILEAPPGRMDRRIHALADKVSRRGADEEFYFAMSALTDWVSARIERGAGAPASNLACLAEVWDKVNRLAADTAQFHFDRKQVILNAFRSIAAAMS